MTWWRLLCPFLESSLSSNVTGFHFFTQSHTATGYQQTGCFECTTWLIHQRNARGCYWKKKGKEREKDKARNKTDVNRGQVTDRFFWISVVPREKEVKQCSTLLEPKMQQWSHFLKSWLAFSKLLSCPCLICVMYHRGKTAFMFPALSIQHDHCVKMALVGSGQIASFSSFSSK